MNIKSRYEYQVNRNKELAMKVSELEQENDSLKEKLESLSHENIEAQLDEIGRLRQQYLEALSGIVDTQRKYRDAIKLAHKTRAQYARKADKAIRKIKAK